MGQASPIHCINIIDNADERVLSGGYLSQVEVAIGDLSK